IAEGRKRWPFRIDAIVLLPDHLHTIWTLPEGDARYPTRWGWIKKEFSARWLRAGGAQQPLTDGRRRDGRRGVLQPKDWAHALRDEDDFDTHFDYIHYNPARHGMVRFPRDWPYSIFHRWVIRGVCPVDWACSGSGAAGALSFDDLEASAME